ncbi:hypothetical protein J6590_088093 [Homalodisca vitripennis]|nr:hypothetical protein J6590_088093 [Homalodisca vitripennis]
MAGGELRRSYTQMDFSLNRVNIRPQLPHLFHQQPPLQMRLNELERLVSLEISSSSSVGWDYTRHSSVRFERKLGERLSCEHLSYGNSQGIGTRTSLCHANVALGSHKK